MNEDVDEHIGDYTDDTNPPLVDGMHISVRIRYDFVVTDAVRLLAAARQAYQELNPDVDEERAAQAVRGAALAIWAVLERAHVIGGDDGHHPNLAPFEPHGLAERGERAQVVYDEPHPLPWPVPHCGFGREPRDWFALPPGADLAP